MQAIYLRESAIRPGTLDGPALSGYTESGKGETPMDVEVKRQPERTELRAEILAPEGDCPQLQRLLAFLSAEDPAVPVFSGLLYPYLLLPLGSFLAGMALGRRRGFCPLFPIACFALYLPMVWLLFNSSALFHCFFTAIPALLGNTAGAFLRKRRSAGER